MPFKINISEKGKSFKIESEDEFLVGKSLGDTIEGNELDTKLDGYQFQITGASDIAGFPHTKKVEGLGLKRLLLKKGWGMHEKKPGLLLRKTVRGKSLSAKTVQVNLNVKKSGSKKLSEIFPDQNNPKEEKSESKDDKPSEQKSDNKKESKPTQPHTSDNKADNKETPNIDKEETKPTQPQTSNNKETKSHESKESNPIPDQKEGDNKESQSKTDEQPKDKIAEPAFPEQNTNNKPVSSTQ